MSPRCDLQWLTDTSASTRIVCHALRQFPGAWQESTAEAGFHRAGCLRKKTLSQRHCVRLHMYYLSYPAAIPPVKLFFMAGDGFDSLSPPLKSITGVNCTLSLDGINPYERSSFGCRNRHTDGTAIRHLAGCWLHLWRWRRTLLRW